MNNATVRVLLVEDDAGHVEAIRRAFKAAMNVELLVAGTLGEYRRNVAVNKPDIAVMDLNLPDGKAMEVLVSPPESGPFPVLIMTSYGNEQTAVEAMKAGALDYVVKSPEVFAEMPLAVTRALHEWRLLRERKHAEESLQVSLRFLETVHRHSEMTPLLNAFVAEIKAYTGCDSVGIRVLGEEGGIPYRAYEGFSPHFYETENPLSVELDQCMCINVIKGAVDLVYPYYTKGGSFYINATTRFLATVSEQEKGKTRNVCNREGYESVALVPFRRGERILGLIHVADHRENMVPLKTVEMLEKAAMQLGAAFERVRAEEALRESERKYRQLVDNALVGVYRSTLEGKFLYVNEALAHIFGCETAEELISSPVHMGYRKPEDRESFLDLLKERGRVPYHEMEISTKAGQLKTLVVSAVFEDGLVSGMVVDITDQKKLEEQLRQAQKMEAVGQLSGGIAHDFNNILSAIIGYGYVTLLKMASADPLRQNIEQILEAADKAAYLTQGLLAFSRKQSSNKKPVDLNAILGRIGKFLLRVLREDIEFKTLLHDGALSVFADANQIEQILMNLATNARDAMPRGGVFTIETGRFLLDDAFVAAHGYGKPGAYAMITVSDTGMGMDEQTRLRIFDPFFTTKDVGHGTGLGLSVVYGILKQHDGFVNVYSEPGKGTTFRIYLPILPHMAEEKKTPDTDFPRKGTETILLAEDDRALRELMTTALQEFGYTVIAAVDGEDAVKKFIENKDGIRLLLFDLIMPKKGGKDAYDEIKKIKPGIRAVFASGYSPDLVRQKSFNDPSVTMVFKPISPKNLLQNVREALDRAEA